MARKFYSDIFELHRAGRCILFQGDYKNRKDIPALPFSRLSKTVPRTKLKSYPKLLKTIGDHIRAWRLDNNLLQADVAKMWEVCEDTIVGWENRETTPTVRQMPKIIASLGYLPLDIDTSSIGGKIKYYRYMKGLSPKQFGIVINADASTVRDWEANKHNPINKKLSAILKKIPS